MSPAARCTPGREPLIGDGLICQGCGYESEIDHEVADWQAGAGPDDDSEDHDRLPTPYAQAARS